MDWTDLVQDIDQWQGFKNTVWKFWFLQNSRNFLTNSINLVQVCIAKWLLVII